MKKAAKSQFPPRWQDCEPFVGALLKREYVSYVDGELRLPMSAGFYLYLYELWQDGHG